MIRIPFGTIAWMGQLSEPSGEYPAILLTWRDGCALWHFDGEWKSKQYSCITDAIVDNVGKVNFEPLK